MRSELFIATAFAAVVAASVGAAPAAAKGPVATVEKAGAERITVSLDLPAGASVVILTRDEAAGKMDRPGWVSAQSAPEDLFLKQFRRTENNHRKIK